MSKLAPVEYPDATCPPWQQFLQTVLPDDDTRAFVRRAVGYSMTGDVSEQWLFLPYGTGANGKSTFLEAIRSVLGDYAQKAPPRCSSSSAHERFPLTSPACPASAFPRQEEAIRFGRNAEAARQRGGVYDSKAGQTKYAELAGEWLEQGDEKKVQWPLATSRLLHRSHLGFCRSREHSARRRENCAQNTRRSWMFV